MSSPQIKLTCIEVRQPIGVFYVGCMNYRDLINITYTDVRRINTNEREVETYMGIQRPLSPNRVKELNSYVNLIDATFPTSIILSVSSKDVSFDAANHVMTIRAEKDVAKVLDGQHRIAGLEGCKSDQNLFQLNVVFFIDMELEDQALVFATINKSQTKVNKSLVADLFEFATTRSPQKTSHNIARALNQKKGSPFYEKIKILGTANDSLRETITQATFVESLIKYISSDPMSDRDIYKRGNIPEKLDDVKNGNLIFRNFFIDNEDASIAQNIWNYFTAVSMKWPQAWNLVRQEYILNKSTGFIALMRFLKDAYIFLRAKNQIPSKEDYLELFNRIDISDNELTNINYLPGTGGQAKLYKKLKEYTAI